MLKVSFTSLIIYFIILEFVNEANFSHEATYALKQFIRIGSKIRERKSFKTSKMKLLEDVLQDRSIIRKYSSTPKIYDYSTCFVALAAPSMEGKTQFAFVLSEVKPLYFPMSVVFTEDEKDNAFVDFTRTQPIYTNYSRIAKTLYRCAKTDLDRVNDGKLLQAGVIKDDHFSTQFLTLGFLIKLAEESSRYPAIPGVTNTGLEKDKSPGSGLNCNNQASSVPPWMEFHSRRPGFTFTSKSLAQVGNIFEGYVLMLDEFKAVAPISFIRNLARAVGLACVVANTNTRIANVVGKNNSSGSSKESVWSFVLTRLDPAYIDVLDEEFQIKTSIENIIKRRDEDDPVFIFFNKYFYQQLEHLRPGVAAFVAMILRDLTTKNLSVNTWTFGKLFDYFGKNLSDALLDRKQYLIEKYAAILGHIALLLPETFADEQDKAKSVNNDEDLGDDENFDINTDEAEIDEIELEKDEDSDIIVGKKAFKQSRFLEHHFFYLTNPVDRSLNWFITFPANNGRNIHDKSCLRIIDKVNYGQFIDWKLEYTEFDRNETLTLIGCQFIALPYTVATILKQASDLLKRRVESVGISVNFKALSLDGNSFEVLSAICVVKASQYYRDEKYSAIHTFKGICADDLIKNIIYEMSLTKNALYMNIEFPLDLLKDLQSVKIPFLYSIDRKDETFDKFCSIEHEFFVKSYERTSNSDQIDGKFEVHTPQGLKIIACECKNYSNSIRTHILEKVIDNSISRHNAKFIFIFCTSVVDKSTKTSKFTQLCNTEKINVYRIERYDNKLAKLVPFWINFKIHENPNRICIIFESYSINNIKLVKRRRE